jgi:hypothetical protein
MLPKKRPAEQKGAGELVRIAENMQDGSTMKTAIMIDAPTKGVIYV